MPAPLPAPKSEGERLLRLVVVSRGKAEICRQSGDKNIATVTNWAIGTFKPKYHSAKLLEERFAIPIDSWDMPPDLPVAPAPVAPSREDVVSNAAPRLLGSGVSAKGLALVELQSLRSRAERADTDLDEKKISVTEWSTIKGLYSMALSRFGKYNGETEIAVSAILKSAAWGKIRVLMDEIADLYPDVAGLIAEKLEKIAADGG